MVAVESSAFGDVLRQFRLEAGLTQEELAERAGLSTRGLSDLERGLRRTPRLGTVRLLADALGLAGVARDRLLASRQPRCAWNASTGLASKGETAPLSEGRGPSQAETGSLVDREHDIA